MRDIGASLRVNPIESFDLSSIVSPFVWYRLLGAGAQADAGGNGPSLAEGNTAPAVGNLALDFAADTYYANASNDAHLTQICDMSNWTDGASFIAAFTAVIPTTPSAALFVAQWGMDNVNAGWNIAISTAREIQLKWFRLGASGSLQQQNFIDPTPSPDVRVSFAIEQYLSDDDTLQCVVYANGSQVGSLTDIDLSANSGTQVGAVEQQLTVGARRTAVSTYQAYYGATAGSELSNLFLCRLATRDATLPQELSAWWADHPYEAPRLMEGR